MSIRIMTAVWQCGPQAVNPRMLMLALADNANDAGECYPSIQLLGEKTCLSKSTVLRMLERLEADGWLAVERRATAGEDGRPRGNLYCLTLKKLGLAAPEMVRKLRPVAMPRSPEPDSRGVTVTPHDADSRSVTVTPHGGREVSHEVSKTGSRGVKTRPPLQPLLGEPSGTVSKNPTPTPSVPEGGRAAFDAFVREQRRKAGLPEQGAASAAELAEAMGVLPVEREAVPAEAVMAIAANVAERCGFAARKVQRAIAAALMTGEARAAPREAGERMVAAWGSYQRAGPLLRYTWSPAVFFAEGHWQREMGWPLDQQRAEVERARGMCR